ncbi:hypothetical protein [Paenibacillus tepidiphilus]|uniref:hypothetical protein n=1 Tax=Paenibacillus tepidiphilus TaxID=2608683 RepID=UPI00123AD2A9|nr:hypothetical protein [Paenibacillus tepidiphilus]
MSCSCWCRPLPPTAPNVKPTLRPEHREHGLQLLVAAAPDRNRASFGAPGAQAVELLVQAAIAGRA